MNEQLYKLLQKAREDAELRKRIWAVKEAKDPALALCELCTAEGFPLTVGGLFSEQEEFSATCSVAVMAVPYSPWMAGMTPSICSLPLWRHWRNKKGMA